ncbi:MAG: toll/interleukin-1 receptor domain-containing protein [Planctomycetota bacterium]|jgi:hypothetical protein
MKIFISHISEEKNLAIVLKEWIESTFLGQISVFLSSDPQSIPAGNKWREDLTSALDESKLLIILYSHLSKTRPWINFEAGCGWIKRIPIIPICHSGLKLEQIGEPISSFQGIEIDDKDFTKKFLGAIAKQASFPKYPKIDKKQFLSEIEKSLSTFDSTITPTEKSQSVKTKHKDLSEPGILALLTDYFNKNAMDIENEAIRYSEIDDILGIPSGSTKRYIKQILRRQNYCCIHEGEEYITFEWHQPTFG